MDHQEVYIDSVLKKTFFSFHFQSAHYGMSPNSLTVLKGGMFTLHQKINETDDNLSLDVTNWRSEDLPYIQQITSGSIAAMRIIHKALVYQSMICTK